MRIYPTNALAAAANAGASFPSLLPHEGRSSTYESTVEIAFPEQPGKPFSVQSSISGLLQRLRNVCNGLTVLPLPTAPSGTKPLENFILPDDEKFLRLYFSIPTEAKPKFGRPHAFISFIMSAPRTISAIKSQGIT